MEEAESRGWETQSLDLKSGFDVTDSMKTMSALEGFDSVIHLAGVLGTEELFDMAHKAIDVNVHGSLNVLQACQKHNVGFVGIHMPEVWANVYQATKKCSMILAEAWRRNYGVQVSTVTAFNAFGPGQKVKGVQKILPTFAHHAWRNEPIPVWGDGSQVVDLVHTSDLARMLVDATQYGDGEEFDGGTGIRLSVNEVANFVLEHTNSSAGIKYLPMRKGETPTDICAKGYGWDLLGWQPQLRDEDLKSTIDWYKEERP
jgi:UDP-glucose 4-epimerase